MQELSNLSDVNLIKDPFPLDLPKFRKFLGDHESLNKVSVIQGENRLAQTTGNSFYSHSSTQLADMSVRVSGVLQKLTSSGSSVDTKISVFQILRTVTNNPVGWCVLVVGTGCVYYFTINKWDESSEQEQEEDKKLLAFLTLGVVGGVAQGALNIGTSLFRRIKSWFREKKNDLHEKTGATAVVLCLTEIIQNYLHNPCSKRLQANINSFVEILKGNFKGKDLLSPDLLFNLGQVFTLAEKHFQYGVLEDQAADQNRETAGITHNLEVDDFLIQRILPLLYAEFQKLEIPNADDLFSAFTKDGFIINNGIQNGNGQKQEARNEVLGGPEVSETEIEIPPTIPSLPQGSTTIRTNTPETSTEG